MPENEAAEAAAGDTTVAGAEHSATEAAQGVPAAAEDAIETAEHTVAAAAEAVTSAAEDTTGATRDALQSLTSSLRGIEGRLASLPSELAGMIADATRAAEHVAEVPVQAVDTTGAAVMEAVAPTSPAPVKKNGRPKARRPLRRRRD